MKKTLIISGLLIGAVGAYAQGVLDWNPQGNWLISVYSPQIATPSTIQTGDSPQDLPAGTTTYTGGWIGGGASPGTGVGATSANGPGGFNYQTQSHFEFGLYLDTSSAAVANDIATGSPVALDGVSDGGLAAIGPNAVDGNSPAGTQVFVGLAAWYDVGGLTSYAASVAAHDPAGFSISSSTIALGSATGTPVEIGPSLGLNSFSLALNSSVPEPSTIALGVIGASAFLMRLRRKQ